MNSLFNKIAIVSCVLVISCKPEVPTHPCEEMTCLNGGTCFNGSCKCPDEYEGEFCETQRMPEALYVTGIAFNGYPTFRNNEPWDGPIGAPACWPDFALTFEWPWGQVNQSHKKQNQEGGMVYWGPASCTFIEDNHIHGDDTLAFFIHEIDGLDSLETISTPELLFSGELVIDNLVFLDSLNPLPESAYFESDSTSMSVRIGLRYEFDH